MPVVSPLPAGPFTTNAGTPGADMAAVRAYLSEKGNATDADLRAEASATYVPFTVTNAANPLTGWHHVTQYGADPTGVADSRAAIQAAFGEDRTVYFPPGTYKVDGRLEVLTNQMTLVSGGDVKFLAAVADGKPVFFGTGQSDITVRGFTFTASVGNLFGKGLIHFIDSDRIVVESNSFLNGVSNGAAVTLEGCRESRVRDNDIDGTNVAISYGIVVGSLSAAGARTADDNIISGNIIKNTKYDSIFVTGSLGSVAPSSSASRNIVTDNVVSNCGDAGIEAGYGSYDTLIQGNTVRGSAGPNILLRGSPRARVTGNHANGSLGTTGSYRGGILVSDQFLGSVGAVISNNVCEGNGGHGIHIGTASATGVVVSDNSCFNNTICGIQTDAPEAVISGGRCFNNTALGVYFSGDYTTVLGVNARGNLFASLDIDGVGLSKKIAYCQGRYTATGAA